MSRVRIAERDVWLGARDQSGQMGRHMSTTKAGAQTRGFYFWEDVAAECRNKCRNSRAYSDMMPVTL